MDDDPRYPWHKMGNGKCFFVPCLNTERVTREGLLAAYKYRFKKCPQAEPYVHKGKFGVMFYLPK